MDMIAADLQNIYYNEGVGTIVYYQQNSGDNLSSLDIPVQRSQKIGKSDIALSRVHYELTEDADSGLKNLQMLAIGNKDNSGNVESGWMLHKYSLTKTNVFPALTGYTMNTILDGVVEMKIKPYNHNVTGEVAAETYSAATVGNARVPDYVVVEIKVVDDNILKTIREKKAMGINASATDDDCRLFSRRIDIDRGQSF
jgi:hypothetical protein